jgi:hypothetical protein
MMGDIFRRIKGRVLQTEVPDIKFRGLPDQCCGLFGNERTWISLNGNGCARLQPYNKSEEGKKALHLFDRFHG